MTGLDDLFSGESNSFNVRPQVSEVELTIQKQIESDRPSKQDSSCSHYTHLLRIRLGNSSIMKGTVALETSVIWTDGDETVR